MYTWISAGAYVGYLTLILFDLCELRRRSAEIYGTAASPAAEGAVTAASSPAATTSPTPAAAPVPAPAAATPASPASPGAPATPATEPHSNPT